MEQITHADLILAIIIRSDYCSDGIEFFTPSDFSQQLGYMNRPKGYSINPHIHNPLHRDVEYTKEVLFIKSGKVRVDFFTNDKEYIKSTIVQKGDVLLLAYGGHGFKMIEDSEIIEVKQGPYAGDADKSRFTPIDEKNLKF